MAEESYFIKLLRDLEATIDQNDLTDTNYDPEIKDKLHEIMYMLIAVMIQEQPIPEIVEQCVSEMENNIKEFDEQNPFIQRAVPHFFRLRELRKLISNNFPDLL